MSTLFTEGLDKKRFAVFEKLAVFANEFVLAGGTALMLQINHRKSFDFDCFSDKPLKKTLLRKCRKVFGKHIKVRVDSSDLTLFRTQDEVRVDFVYYPYSPLHPIVKTNSLPLFSVADLASNKAHTVGRRGQWRDYVDLFFLLKLELFTVKEIIREAQQRFAGEFNDLLFLEQLSYFEDLKITTDTEFLQKSYTPEEIMDFLSSKVGKETKARIKKINDK
jgi:predicted nucleotidyltransferase component of viral defense system